MLTDQDVLTLAAQPARGRRPRFVADPVVDRMMSVTLSLVAELAVARERIDTLERVLERRGLLSRDEVERYAPDEAAARERGQLHEQYLMQVFRVLLQDDGLPVRQDLSSGAVDAARGSDPEAATRGAGCFAPERGAPA
jgi:hypothetical protein